MTIARWHELRMSEVARTAHRRAVVGTFLVGIGCTCCDGPWELGAPAQSLRNVTEFRISVGVQRYSGPFDCAQAGQEVFTVGVGGVEALRLETLDSGEWTRLTAGVASDAGDGSSQECGTAWVVVPSGQEFRVAWDIRDEIPVSVSGDSPPAAGSVYLERLGSEVVLVAGPGVFVFDDDPVSGFGGP